MIRLFVLFLLTYWVNSQIWLRGYDNQKGKAAYFLKGGDSKSYGTKKHYIQQQNKQFKPGNLSVSLNATIFFPNLDSFAHNVYSLEGPMGKFDLGITERISSKTTKDDIQSLKITKEGVTVVKCSIHPDMISYIFSVASAYHCFSDDGSYKIEAPKGKYDLYRMDITGKIKKVKNINIE